MTTPILSSSDIDSILRAPNDAINDRVKYAHILHANLIETARASDLRKRFWEARYHGRSTRFLLTRIPSDANLHNGTQISTEDLINDQSILDWLEKSCGKYVQATYETEEGGHWILIYLEFVPPTSVLNPEEVMHATIPVSEEILMRRLEKETSW
jgi:hypothetical protein